MSLSGSTDQVERYLVDGRPRIRQVVLTNLVGLRVLELENEEARETLSVNLRALLQGDEQMAASSGEGSRLFTFVQQFRYRELSRPERIERMRRAHPWNRGLEVTNAAWISRRLDAAVEVLKADVGRQVATGILDDPAVVDVDDRERALSEMRLLETRMGAREVDVAARTADSYRRAAANTTAEKARRQFEAHVAYYAATRLLLVRIWEDLEVVEPVLYDGGFDRWMRTFDEVIGRVVSHSFIEAREKYGALFDRRNAYAWYTPSEDAYADALWELANTFFGEIESDILGVVCERLLERIDRKLLGQYYTPRDVIRLIWDLIGTDAISTLAETDGRTPRVLDIATGSGGFLVEAARRLRDRFEQQSSRGAAMPRQEWVNRLSENLVGAEIQRFPAYLAELNLLIQLAASVATDPHLRVPTLGVLALDTLALHDPVASDDHEVPALDDATRRDKADRLRRAAEAEFLMDVACGNPPYIGEKIGSPLLQATRAAHPYWNDFVGQHPDYLYWFLILGLSKLREGGRFGFITTEYWLRAAGGRVLREYIGRRAQVERIVLFRDFRLFPDAPGQHSMIVVGRRAVATDGLLTALPTVDEPARPTISIYRNATPTPVARELALAAMRDARSSNGVETFRSSRSPNELLAESWAEVVLPPADVRRRERLRRRTTPLEFEVEEGVLTSADALPPTAHETIPGTTLTALGFPGRRAGIFILQPDEVAALGTLNEAEQAVLRPVINVRDVLPYAAILPDEPETMVYLTRPTAAKKLDAARAQAMAFPRGTPALERHLHQFRPLLERRVAGYGEKRPWWSIHRPRQRTISRDNTGGEWANYCLTSRWGAGERLIVGLAPSGTVPQSGLHAILPQEGVPAAYASGVLNATAVQDLASTLPPGQIRAEDLTALGLPYIVDSVDEVAGETTELAGIVSTFARTWDARFPDLLTALLEDLGLSVSPTASWRPLVGPATSWGALRGLAWVDELVARGGQAKRTRSIQQESTIFGREITVVADAASSLTIRLAPEEDDLHEAVTAMLYGQIASKAALRDIPETLAPVDADELVRQYGQHQQHLSMLIDEYRRRRSAIDQIVDALL